MSVTIEALKCPHCAAPLPSGARDGYVCAYCAHVLTNIPRSAAARWRADDDRDEIPEDVGLPRVHVGGRTYAVLGRLARGDGSDVFLARRAARLTEMVVIKALRARADEDLLAREWRAVEALSRSEAQGHEFFGRLVPQPVAHGRLTGAVASAGTASVFRWRSGFLHTMADVRREHASGVDPRAAVWMWKRLLEVLGWVHRAGYAHGAVLPEHVLVHPRDHGVALAGWSSATRLGAGERLAATSASREAFYPRASWERGAVTAATDLTMAARVVAHALGGEARTGEVPSSVPRPLAALVGQYARDDAPADDAWDLMERVSEAGREAFGPPRFVPFAMPGWR